MLLLIVFLVCIFLAVGAGLLASWSDMKGMTIPNMCSLIVLSSFAVCWLILWAFGREDVFGPLLSHLLGCLAVFLVTLVMFATKGIGGGDAKLATAFALWTGIQGLAPFLFYMSILGGLLGLAALVLKKYKPLANPVPGSWIARVQAGESKVPYGVAITVGALASFANLGYFSGDVLSSFLLQ